MMLLISQILSDQLSDCGFMLRGRVWQPVIPCFIEENFDFSTWNNAGMNISGNSTDMDMSIINVVNLAEQKNFLLQKIKLLSVTVVNYLIQKLDRAPVCVKMINLDINSFVETHAHINTITIKSSKLHIV
ncbi:Hypothetical_protein [Hexamita inflata]|uniref:Hypothetical_protein n=1 Tax=Hexamita inflata TaxID=28002 RepID=A0AA86UD28_9EUKA|nr:Hypothetical protein HINF_LOCUS38534 [Hexamita inflata]